MKLAPMMEVKKTVLLTFFKDPQRHVNNAVEKQTKSLKQETLIFYYSPMSCLWVASTFYGIF